MVQAERQRVPAPQDDIMRRFGRYAAVAAASMAVFTLLYFFVLYVMSE